MCYFPALRLLRVAVLGVLSLGWAPGADSLVHSRLEAAVRANSGLEEDLLTLCDRIGARPADSPAMRAALQWALRAFEAAGLQAPRLETFEMPRSWSEGETAVEVLAPSAFAVSAAATALSPATPEWLEAEAVATALGKNASNVRRDRALAGKIAVVPLDDASSFDSLGHSQLHALLAMRGAVASDAKAVLFASTRRNQLLYRHLHSLSAELDPIPSAVVAREDGLRILRLLQAGDTVRVRLRLPNQIGPRYETANAVADIPGSDLAAEIVLIGAHLDSWDLGSGCLDNAVNAAMVVHVARSIRASGVEPRRTLRFVLFGAEELGLFGSRAYAERHGAQIGDHVLAIVHDMGGGRMQGYATGGRQDLLPVLENAIARARLSHPLRNTDDGYFISDNLPFMLQGVPSVFAVQDTADYFVPYHSPADTFDKVQVQFVTEAAAIAAGLMVEVSTMEERPGARLERREVLAWLRRERLVRHFQFLGVWDSWWSYYGPTN